MATTLKPEDFNVLVALDVYRLFEDLWTQYESPELVWFPFDMAGSRDGLDRVLPLTDCLVTIYHGLSAAEHAQACRLKLIQLPSAGYDCVDLYLARVNEVLVANNGGANAASVAEHTIMLMLALCRQFLFHHRTVADGSWINRKYRNQELKGKTLGIVGLGNIGSHLARLAKAFDMRLVFTDIKEIPSELTRELGLERLALDELLSVADIVSLHVPLTEITRKMINPTTLSLMKSDAILINTSRGQVVDEIALTEALAQGRLAGAGLDVFEQEPLPQDSPLVKLDNVVFSPHAGPSQQSRMRIAQLVLQNLYRVKVGEDPLYLIGDRL